VAESKRYGLTGVADSVEIGKGGPRVTDDSGAIEARNNADSAFAVVRAADPVGQDDVVTLRYLQTRADTRVTGQIDGGAPPAAGSLGRVFVCTTTGGAYTVNHLYYDDGAAWVDVGPAEGQTIKVTDDLTGGAVEFWGDHVYVWDADGSVWRDLGPLASEFAKNEWGERAALAFGTASPLNVGSAAPADAIAFGGVVIVTQAFDGTAPTLTIGDAGDADRLATVGEVNLKATGVYAFDCGYTYSVDTQITATYVADGSAAGAAVILVHLRRAS
jgi:hypothetical protein